MDDGYTKGRGRITRQMKRGHKIGPSLTKRHVSPIENPWGMPGTGRIEKQVLVQVT